MLSIMSSSKSSRRCCRLECSDTVSLHFRAQAAACGWVPAVSALRRPSSSRNSRSSPISRIRSILAVGSNSAARSMSLLARASPRATEPNRESARIPAARSAASCSRRMPMISAAVIGSPMSIKPSVAGSITFASARTEYGVCRTSGPAISNGRRSPRRSGPSRRPTPAPPARQPVALGDSPTLATRIGATPVRYLRQRSCQC